VLGRCDVQKIESHWHNKDHKGVQYHLTSPARLGRSANAASCLLTLPAGDRVPPYAGRRVKRCDICASYVLSRGSVGTTTLGTGHLSIPFSTLDLQLSVRYVGL
jgi:hypothetical protein